FVLYQRTPEIDFAAGAAIRVPYLLEVLNILRRIDSTRAVPIRHFFSVIRDSHMPSSGRNSAPRLKILPRNPRLAIERFQPRFIPPPKAVAHNGRDVVGNLHWAAGVCSGSVTGTGT